MDEKLAVAQALRYAEELRTLYAAEREQRRAAEEALRALDESYRTTVRALAAALELRDDDTGSHAKRVTDLALQLAERFAPELCADPELEFGFLLHDLGKIGVPDGILLKPGPLTEGEHRRVEIHPVLGDQIVRGIPFLGGIARDVVAHHHERWDGTGYPHGIARESIPEAARIFAVADTFDAMTNDRPYRRALPVERALEEIERGAGSQFDPAIAAAFLELAADLRSAA